ncbi:hypothetical protein HPB52_012024 [Rhipicephalus sanguineus]|uniref:Uncharacterized protein n=1 Tax=Rhipicephalus sanguineus TaxID=34632 RepID=A0A9D4PLG5_RHISA|nr:hypothetical protein HPB52_012024 [Rhipicephalus sanguineus]
MSLCLATTGDPENTHFAERPPAMLPRLCPPVPPFHPAYPRAWFMQLDACLAVNGVTSQPLMHDILLDALPVELRHLSAASSSSPQPYDNLCAAVLARYGETYRPLRGPPSRDRDLPSPAMSLSTSRPATSAAVPVTDDPPDDVQVPTPEVSAPDVAAAAIDQSATRCVASTPSADGPSGMPVIRPSSLSSAHDTSLTSASTLATLLPDLEADTDNLSPAVSPSLAEVSPSTVPEHDLSPTSKLCASCQQRPASPLTATAAEVRAPYQLPPHLQDAATMTEAPEDDMPAGSPMAEQAPHVTPATSAGIQHPDLRTSLRVPPAEGASTRTGASSEPTATIYACSMSSQICSGPRDTGWPPTRHVATVQARCADLYSHRTCRNFVSRRRQRARSAPTSHRHCCCLYNASPHAHLTFSDRFQHAESRALWLLPTASIRRDPRPLRNSQSRPPENHWSLMVISR